MILLVDNYDSFVHNLARYFARLGQQTHVVRNDATNVERVRQLRPDALVLSPGPCAPDQAGCSLDLVRELHAELPILGVCLGHQVIAQAFGGRIVRSQQPMHGRTSLLDHASEGLFSGLPCPLTVGRYHSLVVEKATLPECLNVTARTDGGVVMALAHRQLPVFGVQFHPESVLTEGGYEMLANFLRLAKLTGAATPAVPAEYCPPPMVEPRLPGLPVTF